MSVAEFSPRLVSRSTARRPVARAARRARNVTLTCAAVFAVALTLTGLSLDHLASGIILVTGCVAWQGWALAVGFDLGYVVLELIQLAVEDKLRARIRRWAQPTIVGTILGSAALNAFAFAAHAPA